MKCTVIGLSDPGAWRKALNRFERHDIYFLPEYHHLHELEGDGRAKAFFAQDGESALFHPFMMRRVMSVTDHGLAKPCYDIESVYGYTGPLTNTADRTFLTSAWIKFFDWCQSNSIVAEFVRCNPMIDNYWLFHPSYTLVSDRETVVVDLCCTEGELWKTYPSLNRNMIRKAQKFGLHCSPVSPRQGMKDFLRLYTEAMNRVGADNYYHFSRAYYEHLEASLGDRYKLFTVKHGDAVVAAAIFLLHMDTIHYHLAGHDPKYNSKAPNNLLLHEAAVWGLRNGCRWMHLGGGRSSSPSDSLLRFKASISRARRTYHTARRVHNEIVYHELCSLWMKKTGSAARPPYFLLYRLTHPLPSTIEELS